MDWRDQGTLLTARRHGETAAIIEVFTAEHGRHLGVVRGGSSRKLAPVLQPGTRLDLEWRARLEDHLGSFRVEPLQSRAAFLMDDRFALAGLNAVCSLLKFSMPEREPHAALYAASEALFDDLGRDPNWPRSYLNWELLLLKDLGFGLDLKTCAVTGSPEGLCYVSPTSGRAVSKEGAGAWAERLLPFPDPDDVASGLRTTGYFLENWLAPALGDRELPNARARLLTQLEKERLK